MIYISSEKKTQFSIPTPGVDQCPNCSHHPTIPKGIQKILLEVMFKTNPQKHGKQMLDSDGFQIVKQIPNSWDIYPLVMTNISMENRHRNSGFVH